MKDEELLAAVRAEVRAQRDVAPDDAVGLDPRAAKNVQAAVLEKLAVSETPSRTAVAPLPVRVVTWAAPFALAAGLFLWLRSRPSDVPAYAVEVLASAATVRGDLAASPNGTIVASGPDVAMSVVLRPEVEIVEPLAARAFVRRGDLWLTAPLEIEVSPSGSVRLTGRTAAFRGADEVRVVLGPLRGFREAEALAAVRSDVAGYRVIAIAVR